MQFVLTFGLISALGDFVYEGARSITGPYLATFGASAEAADAATNSPRPTANMLRRPKRSPSAAPVTSKTAKRSLGSTLRPQIRTRVVPDDSEKRPICFFVAMSNGIGCSMSSASPGFA